LCISHIIQLTPQQQSAELRNSAGAEALAVARRPNEASREKHPAAVGIERFFSLKGPREENNVRASFLLLFSFHVDAQSAIRVASHRQINVPDYYPTLPDY